MSKTIPPTQCTFTTLINQGEPLLTALKKRKDKALQAAITKHHTGYGFVPRVVLVELKDKVHFHCENQIDVAEDRLNHAKTGDFCAVECKRFYNIKRNHLKLTQVHLGNEKHKCKIDRSYNRKHKHSPLKRCNTMMLRNGFVVRITINGDGVLTIYLLPAVFCPVCEVRRTFAFFDQLQYCHRVLLPKMVKRSRYVSKAFEQVIVAGFSRPPDMGAYIFEFDHEEVIKRDYLRLARFAWFKAFKNRKKEKKPPESRLNADEEAWMGRQSIRARRLKGMVLWAQSLFSTEEDDGFILDRSWYSQLRLFFSDANGDPCWR